MNVKYRPGRFLNSEYRNSHPAYYRGYLHALVEIRQDPMYEKGFQDAVNGVVDPDNKMPYYLRGVEEYAGGDGLGLEETYPYARIPIGQLKRLGSLRGVSRDPRKLAELAKDVARRKAREMARGYGNQLETRRRRFRQNNQGKFPDFRRPKPVCLSCREFAVPWIAILLTTARPWAQADGQNFRDVTLLA